MTFSERDVIPLPNTNCQFLVIFLAGMRAMHFGHQVYIYHWSSYWYMLKILFCINILWQKVIAF